MTAVFQPGRYWGKAMSQNLGKSKNKGTPQFSITFDVLGTVNPRDPGGALLPCPGGTRTVFWYMTDKNVPYFLEDLQALGYRKDSLAYLDPNRPDFHDFAETECELYCQHEQYEGQAKEKWKLSRQGAGITCEPLPDPELRKLDAMFASGLKKLAGEKKPEAVKPLKEKFEVAQSAAIDAINAELQEAGGDFDPNGIPF